MARKLKFKVGDTVRTTNGSYLKKGTVTTIDKVEAGSPPPYKIKEGHWVYGKDLELVPTTPVPAKGTLSITAEQVKKAAKDNPCAMPVLKTLFPGVLEPEVFSFKSFVLSLETGPKVPIYVGHGDAPAGFEDKCLILDERYYTVEQRKVPTGTALIFRKKE